MRPNHAMPQSYNTTSSIHPAAPPWVSVFSWKLKSEACHTVLVLVDHRSAVFLGILRITEQHAFVSRSFLVFAYTAWLLAESGTDSSKLEIGIYLDVGGWLTRGLQIYSHVC